MNILQAYDSVVFPSSPLLEHPSRPPTVPSVSLFRPLHPSILSIITPLIILHRRRISTARHSLWWWCAILVPPEGAGPTGTVYGFHAAPASAAGVAAARQEDEEGEEEDAAEEDPATPAVESVVAVAVAAVGIAIAKDKRSVANMEGENWGDKHT